jgi:O-antigen ligase
LIPVDRTRLAFYLTFAAVVASLASIAASQILLGAAAATLLLRRERWHWPPLLWPLAGFLLWTFLSLAASPDPWGGRAQIRKLVLFATLALVVTTFRSIRQVRWLVVAMTGMMTLSALWSLVQFAKKYVAAQSSGRPFYDYYVGERITGFMSHWMTLGGLEMMVLLLGAAVWMGARDWPKRHWLLPAFALILVSLLVGFTRSIWLGTAVGGLYLIWQWKRWMVLVTPVPIALLLMANPAAIRERAWSAFEPKGDLDSNQFRVVCRRTGWEMIKAHPWFGVGPMQVQKQFDRFVPADIPKPLPTGWYGHLHNVYVHYAAERGLPALLFLMWWLAGMGWHVWRGARVATGEPRWLLHGCVAILLGTLATAFYELNLGDSEVLTTFLATMACGFVVLRQPAVPAPVD